MRVLHPRIAAAAGGELPPWAEAGKRRRAHMERVAALMDVLATAHGASDLQRARWRAAGWLHDVVRDAAPSERRTVLGDREPELPEPLLHGPAAVVRLEAEGVDDPEFLTAVSYHSRGHESFGALGKALSVADFAEPGRSDKEGLRARIRAEAVTSLDRAYEEAQTARHAYALVRAAR